jgi:hypothetical protein
MNEAQNTMLEWSPFGALPPHHRSEVAYSRLRLNTPLLRALLSPHPRI